MQNSAEAKTEIFRRRIREFNPDNLPQPRLDAPPAHLFDHSNLDLEIGCGLGMHSIQYAKSNPDRTLIAIEHTAVRAKEFKKRVAQSNLQNLFPVHANAISWVTKYLKPSTLDRIFILYPNPYPKQRQANQRWHRMPFMRYLLSCLKPGGEISLATNLEYYALEARDYFLNSWDLIEVQFAKFQNDFDGQNFSPQTHFEKKYYERGDAIFRLKYISRESGV